METLIVEERDGLRIIECSNANLLNSASQVMTTSSNGHQTIAVPSSGGGLSIVTVVPSSGAGQHSVIQAASANQQSVIQTVQGLQSLSKGGFQLIPLGKNQSVIQSAGGSTANHLPSLQLTVTDEDGEPLESETKKRREILARRPSYRKIYNELSSADSPVAGSGHAGSGVISSSDGRGEGMDDDDEDTSDEDDDDQKPMNDTITVTGVTVVPAGTILGGHSDGLQTLVNAGSSGQGTIVQYATQGSDGQFFVPVTVSAADLQAYQIRSSGGGNGGSLGGSVVMAAASSGSLHAPHAVVEEASRKREVRLLKNREAARECRRKKKEYIKCLENRVAVLENQNKALIEELKALKELYCQKSVD